MTAKTIVTINFSEIPAIEMTCTKCGAGMTLPIVKEKAESLYPPFHYQCFGCGTTLWDGENDQRLIRVVAMLKTLAMWKALKESKQEVGFDISFSMDIK